MTAEYIERKPVSFRKHLVNSLLKELQKNADGGAQARKMTKPNLAPRR